MKTKLFGIALVTIGVIGLGYTICIVLLSRGMFAAIYGIIPLVAGWIIFNSQKESPNTTEKQPASEEIKSGFARIRSFLKGLL